jgi:two-component system sensor histidine kinase AlgZ
MNSSEKPTSETQNKAADTVLDDFFIPDLCTSRSVLVLVVAGELFALMVAILNSSFPSFDWISLGLVSLLTQWITLSSAAVICSVRPWLAKVNVALALGFCQAVILIDTAVFSLVGQWALIPEFVYFWQEVDYGSVVQNLLLAVIISSMVFRYFLVQNKLRQKESAELNARLQSLQSRIRPHFLFNSMNIIASLIAVDPDTAEEVVEDLSELFRASLKETGSLVPLKNEIDLCKKYAHIEQLRLGKRLQIEWKEVNFPEELYQSVEVPLLLLQPLLENAIYHGVQPRAEGGLIEISLECEEGQVRITIVNPLPTSAFQANDSKVHKGNQMALKNIKYRLEAVYGDKGQLEQEQLNEEFVTVLSFPKNVLR